VGPAARHSGARRSTRDRPIRGPLSTMRALGPNARSTPWSAAHCAPARCSRTASRLSGRTGFGRARCAVDRRWRARTAATWCSRTSHHGVRASAGQDECVALSVGARLSRRVLVARCLQPAPATRPRCAYARLCAARAACARSDATVVDGAHTRRTDRDRIARAVPRQRTGRAGRDGAATFARRRHRARSTAAARTRAELATELRHSGLPTASIRATRTRATGATRCARTSRRSATTSESRPCGSRAARDRARRAGRDRRRGKRVVPCGRS